MNDEHHDPDFAWIRTKWQALPPDELLKERVMAGYREEMKPWPRKRWIKLLPIPAAAAAALAFMTVWKQAPVDYYRPVAQPRFIVVSQGEQP